jgi:twinkle protein
MQNTASSNFLHHAPCDACGSSDALGVYEDGSAWCFSCGTYKRGDTLDTPTVPAKSTGLIALGEARSLPRRKLSEETCRKFGYTVSELNGQPVQVANYKNSEGKIVAQKIRFADKSFKFLGNPKEAGLYGEHLWRDGGKMLVITEGELDALSMSQAQGNRFPVVSLPNGAQAAKKAVQKSLDFVESFDKVVLMFDMDEPGRAAAIEVAQLLTPSKAHIATLPLKDASDMLVAGRQAELISAMWDAKLYRPDGIIAGSELLDLVLASEDTPSIPYPFEALNLKTHGMRRGELITITAGSGVGKSQVCREIAYHLIKQGESLGYIALEENVKRTALGLMGLAINKPLHLSREGVDDDTIKSAFNDTVGNGRVYLYDHFGSMATDNLLNRVRYLAKSCGVGWVILDHLSIVVSGVDDGDERKAIDVIMTKLRSLVEETGIGLVLVSHLRRPSGDKGWEEGLQTSLNSLRGSAAIAQLSDICIGVERNQQGDNPNVSTLRVLKNRFSGETGVGCYLVYEQSTGRMVETDDPNTPFDDETTSEDF